MEEDKVLFASLHLEGAAETWFGNFFDTLEGVTWEQFVEELCARFANEGHENVEGEFSKLQQTTTVKAYPEQFEDLEL